MNVMPSLQCWVHFLLLVMCSSQNQSRPSPWSVESTISEVAWSGVVEINGFFPLMVKLASNVKV